MTIKFGEVTLACTDCEASGTETTFQGKLQIRGEGPKFNNDYGYFDQFLAGGKIALEAGAHHHKHPGDTPQCF